MRYFVHAPNGQRYGPADVATLQGWISEGRLLPTSLVEEELSGQRIAASAVPGLAFPGHPITAQPTHQVPPGWAQPGQRPPSPYGQAPSPYYRPGMAQPQPQQPMYGLIPGGSSEYTTSLVLGIIGAVLVVPCFCSGPFLLLPVILTAIGLIIANKAKSLGHPQAKGSYTLNLVVLILSGLALIGSMIFFAGIGAF